MELPPTVGRPPGLQADAVAALALVFAKGDAGGPDVLAEDGLKGT